MKSRKNKLPASTIDGLTEADEISEIFTNSYKSILDSPSCSANWDTPTSVSGSRGEMFHLFFDLKHIDTAIDRINSGIDFDLINAKHLKFCGPRFKSVISRLFTSFMTHCYFPKEMLKGVIKPTLKTGRYVKVVLRVIVP